MFQEIRRVISEADHVGGETLLTKDLPTRPEQKPIMDGDFRNMNSSSSLGDEERKPHFIVENDHDQINPMKIQNVPLTVFGDRGTVPRMMMMAHQQQFLSSSSLSCDEETEDEALVNLHVTPIPLPRMNSRESWSSSHRAPSSQNSSRDWGWFEDVYLTDRGGNLDVAAHDHGDKTVSKSSIDNGMFINLFKLNIFAVDLLEIFVFYFQVR